MTRPEAPPHPQDAVDLALAAIDVRWRDRRRALRDALRALLEVADRRSHPALHARWRPRAALTAAVMSTLETLRLEDRLMPDSDTIHHPTPPPTVGPPATTSPSGDAELAIYYDLKAVVAPTDDDDGFDSILEKVFSRFFERMLEHDYLSQWFVGVDPKRQEQKFRGFFVMATGGPKKYTGKAMEVAHDSVNARLPITERAWRETIGVLADTLREFRVPDRLIGRIPPAVEPLKQYIVKAA